MNSPLNWKSIVTVASVLVLVGSEVFGVAIATAWAMGGFFALGEVITDGLMVVLCVLGAIPMIKLAKMGFAIEPIRGRSEGG